MLKNERFEFIGASKKVGVYFLSFIYFADMQLFSCRAKRVVRLHRLHRIRNALIPDFITFILMCFDEYFIFSLKRSEKKKRRDDNTPASGNGGRSGVKPGRKPTEISSQSKSNSRKKKVISESEKVQE